MSDSATSLRRVEDIEINGFKKQKLPQDQQDTYSQAHEAWSTPYKIIKRVTR